jgi:dTDP-N-acetylfucosamine:lipid II N-acetylfucosaminyltransferase
MDIHIFPCEGFYTRRFLEFFTKNFSKGTDVIVFRQKGPGNFKYQGELKDRIVYVPDFKSFLFNLHPLLKKSDHIYLHYFGPGPALLYWYLMPSLIKKASWIVWGYDLYWGLEKRHTVKDRVYEYLRMRIIRRLHSFLVFIDGDYDIIRTRYKAKGERYHVFYPLPVDIYHFKENVSESPSGRFNILLGNSADYINEHRELFALLDHIKETELTWICPLSYGGDKEYIDEIIKLGKQNWGDKFIPLLDFIPPEEYAQLLDEVSVVIMNFHIQAGLGNILSLFYRGKKVYLRGDTTPYEYFKKMGFSVYDTRSLVNLSQVDLVKFGNADKIKNQELFLREFSQDKFVRMWQNAFKGIGSQIHH